MLSKKILCTSLVAAFASIGFAAHAQDRDHDGRDDRDGRYEQHDRDARHDRDNRSWNNGYDRRDHDRDMRAMGGPERHHWRRGDRLPDEYRHGRSVDWRAHHLHAPPRGYQWVDVDGDFVLVALTSGLIADLIVNSR